MNNIFTGYIGNGNQTFS